MAVLEQIVPQESISAKGSNLGYAEKQLLGSYMDVSSAEVHNCADCTGCQIGSCFNCANYTD